MPGPSRFYKTNHQAPWTSEVKKIAKVPVVGVGRFTDPDEMLRVLRSGQYDIIGCARPSIADPWLPRKIDEGRIEDIAECIGCNQCIARFEYGVPIVCTQNPTALEEYRRGWHPERFATRGDDELIAVVGAGLAGLECARVLGKRGYRVHLIEAEKDVGGHLGDVAALPGLAEWFRAVSYREAQLKRMPNVELMLGTGAATAEDLLDYGAAKIVLATGAQWNGNGIGAAGPDPIPGIDSALPGFVTPEQVFAGKDIGERVVVLDSDGYFMAVSLAEMLADRGKSVTLVTLFDRVAPYTDFTLEGPNLRRMMREKGIASRVATWVESADGRGRSRFDSMTSIAMDRSGPIGRWPACCPAGAGLKRKNSNATPSCCARAAIPMSRSIVISPCLRHEWVKKGIAGVYRAGDCLAPRYLADVVFDGHRMGREIDSPDPQRPRAIIREHRIWGGETWPGR